MGLPRHAAATIRVERLGANHGETIADVLCELATTLKGLIGHRTHAEPGEMVEIVVRVAVRPS